MVHRSAAAKKAAKTRKLRAAGRKATETKKRGAAAGANTKSIRWLSVEGRDIGPLGHGVEFFHIELGSTESGPIAFLEGYGWRGGKLLQTPPDSVKADHWLKILDEAREAVLVFLFDEDNLTGTPFQHGSVWTRANA